MRNSIFILFIFALMLSCNTTQRLTNKEKELILLASDETPFDVLKINILTDSLILRKKCSNIDFNKDTAIIAHLIKRMKSTLDVESGVGLAAPQIGISRNLFLIMRIDKPEKNVEVVINPKIVSKPEQTVCFERDGCLSIPNVSGNSVRYPWIEVAYFNEKGEKITEKLSGHSRQTDFTGIIFQHEYDHLQGVMFTDKLCK